MKITKSQLKQVIKEEIVEALSFTMGGDPIAMPTKPDPEPEPEHVEGPERAKEIMIGISELLKAVGDLNQVTEEEAIAVLGAIIEYSIDGLKGGRPSGETTIKEDFSDLLSDLGSGLFGGGEEGGIEGLDLSTIDLTQLGAGIEDISGDIQSELDGIPEPLKQLVLKKILDTIEIKEGGAVANFGGRTGNLGAVAGRSTEAPSVPQKLSQAGIARYPEAVRADLIKMIQDLSIDDPNHTALLGDMLAYLMPAAAQNISQNLGLEEKKKHDCSIHPGETHEEWKVSQISEEEIEEASEKTLKKVEKSTRKTAKKKFPKDKERQDAYVYGTKRKLGWKPKRERGKK